LVVIGDFENHMVFGATTLAPGSKWVGDIFVAKLNSNGKWLWAKRAGSPNTGDLGRSIAVDRQGNIIIVGDFINKADFGHITLTSFGSAAFFIAKLDPNGKWLWAKSGGGHPGHDSVGGVAIGKQNHIYITGYYRSQARFGSTTLTSGKDHHIDASLFVAKLDSNGKWLWAESAVQDYSVGPDSSAGLDIALDIHENIAVVGVFRKTAWFGKTKLSGKKDSIIVTKLDSNGKWLWAKQADSEESDRGLGIAVDLQGNVHVTGYFWKTATFHTTKRASKGLMDVFWWKIKNSP